MIQFNLLPDVKLEFIKARRMKRMVTLIAVIVAALSIVIFIFMVITVNVIQKKSLSDLNTDITKYSKQLKAVPDLDKILTVQNQLNTLGSLHDGKPATSRIYAYIAQLTPTQASLSQLSIDFAANTISLGGNAQSLDVISTYTDTLKSTTFTTTDNKVPTNAFSSVVLSSFGRDDKGASFTISLNFDPAIFKENNGAELKVPSGTKTNQSALFGAEK